VTMTDCLRIDVDAQSNVRFEVVLAHRNFHSCTVSGIAKFEDMAFEWEPPADDREVYESVSGPWHCRLRVTFSSTDITIEDVGSECRAFYCGVAASLDSRFPRELRRETPTTCPDAPMPDIEAAERAAKKLLRRLRRGDR